MVLYLNITCFTLVFCKHCKILNEYINKLENENVSKNSSLTINIIIQEILSIRHSLDKSINHFKNIFSSITLLGAMGFAILIERIKAGNIDLFHWASFIIYFIVQIIFVIVIIRVSKHQNYLSTYIKEPLFVEKFIKRYTIGDVKKRFENKNPELLIINMEEENASTIDWIILNKMVKEKWTEFSVFGIEIQDFNLIKKGILLVTLIVTLNSYINTN